MSSEDQDARRIEAALAQRAGADADAAQIADALCATWQAIDAALSPVLGSGGVAALYKRSIYVAGATHPWLAGLHDSVQNTLDLSALKPVFAQQTSVDAAVGGNALLQTFYQLLASLIGPSLTERLLRSVWADTSSGAPAQDTSP